jgi:hypothetical protein
LLIKEASALSCAESGSREEVKDGIAAERIFLSFFSGVRLFFFKPGGKYTGVFWNGQ